MAVSTLYIEELKATMRGRFAWLGTGVILLAVGIVATVGTQDTWLDGYGIIAYFLVPLAFIPLTAVALANPRANRFVESVFTSPVERGDWLTAKILVVLTLAAGYCVALFPMMFVYAYHVGFPLLLRKFLIWTPMLLVTSVATGLLIGVMFVGDSIAAPAATGMGLLLAYAGFVPLQELLVAQGNGATRTGHLTLTSPAALLKNVLGFALVAPTVPETTTRTWVCLLFVLLTTLALAVWCFLRLQGVETWEANRKERWIMTLAIAAIVTVPVVFADTDYDKRSPRNTDAPPIAGLFARVGSNLALTAPGGQPPERCCSTILNRDDLVGLGTDEPSKRDLLLLLPVDRTDRISDLHIQVVGDAGLQATADPSVLNPAASALETRTYANDLGPPAANGRHVVNGWVARVPVTLTPTKPWDIGGDHYPLRVMASYRVGSEGQPRTFGARAAVNAQVSSAIYEMGIASLLFPMICFGAAFMRWRNTN